jgi:hypothetical protein
VDENDEVLISGFGRRGKAKGDIPGVRFKIVKVSGVGLLALWKEKKVRVQSISFHGGSSISGASLDSVNALSCGISRSLQLFWDLALELRNPRACLGLSKAVHACQISN